MKWLMHYLAGPQVSYGSKTRRRSVCMQHLLLCHSAVQEASGVQQLFASHVVSLKARWLKLCWARRSGMQRMKVLDCGVHSSKSVQNLHSINRKSRGKRSQLNRKDL